MNRRDAILALIALCAAPLASEAQQADKVYRVAVSFYATAAALSGPAPKFGGMAVFMNGLKARGYIEGRNLTVDRWARGGLDFAGQDKQMADMVGQKPDVIVVDGTSTALRLAKFTSTIPVVMAASVDPVGAGLAQSLARPGGNVTGLALDVGVGSEEKRLELFLELLPKVRHLAFVGFKGDWEGDWGKAIQRLAAKRHLDLFFAEGTPAGFDDALAAIKRRKSDAFFVALSPVTGAFYSSLIGFSLSSGIPSSCGIVEFADLGCVMAYGQSYKSFFSSASTYVDKILKGAKPGDLPIEQPTKFDLVINLKTAKALNITIPPSIMVRADRVIE